MKPLPTIIQVIGLVNNAIGLLPFTRNNLPKKNLSEGDSIVRVAVALNSRNGPEYADGDAPMILAFQEDGQFIGNTLLKDANITIRSGRYADLPIYQMREGPNKQAAYLQVCARNDAICVAYISQVRTDGTQWGWVGDIGRHCGQEWYPSNLFIGNKGKNAHMLDCTWLSGNHSSAVGVSALQIHMPSFTPPPPDHKPFPTSFSYCKLPNMHFHTDYNYKFFYRPDPDFEDYNDYHSPQQLTNETYWMDQTNDIYNHRRMPTLWDRQEDRIQDGPSSKAKRTFSTEERRFTHLVASAHEQHSAREVCGSGTSRGPDFVSLKEGFFCDMETKTLWPLCAEEEEGEDGEEGCYHWGTHALGKRGERVGRKYGWVEEWSVHDADERMEDMAEDGRGTNW